MNQEDKTAEHQEYLRSPPASPKKKSRPGLSSPMGSVRKLLRSPGGSVRKLLHLPGGNGATNQKNKHKRLSQFSAGELMNPKVFSELSTDDQAKLELLVATELGMH
jgi:hypothetical protein